MLGAHQPEGPHWYLNVLATAYYAHRGLRVRSEWDVPLDGPHMWGMVRDPS